VIDGPFQNKLGRATLHGGKLLPDTTIRFMSFPLTDPPPRFAPDIVDVFRKYESQIGTQVLSKGLTSSEVLSLLRDDLVSLGFQVEGGKQKEEKIERPVFFGENGLPTLKYEVDAYHPKWRCGLEIEAGRAQGYRITIGQVVVSGKGVFAILTLDAVAPVGGPRWCRGEDTSDSTLRIKEDRTWHTTRRLPSLGILLS